MNSVRPYSQYLKHHTQRGCKDSGIRKLVCGKIIIPFSQIEQFSDEKDIFQRIRKQVGKLDNFQTIWALQTSSLDLSETETLQTS